MNQSDRIFYSLCIGTPVALLASRPWRRDSAAARAVTIKLSPDLLHLLINDGATVTTVPLKEFIKVF
jgi:hypothetical protein